jgi:transcriptional regulator with XRE-family HTH domain
MMNTLADLLAKAPALEDEKRFVDKSLQLAGLITGAMQRQGLTQKALADMLGKQESEVSRWLTGLHNFTLKTLTRLEAVLGEDLVLTFRDQTTPKAAAVDGNWAAPGAAWQTGRIPSTQRTASVQVDNYDLLQAA